MRHIDLPGYELGEEEVAEGSQLAHDISEIERLRQHRLSSNFEVIRDVCWGNDNWHLAYLALTEPGLSCV